MSKITTKNSNKIKWSTGYKVFTVFNTVFLILLSCCFILPYINIIAKSLSSPMEVQQGNVTFFPKKFTLNNFTLTLSTPAIWSGALMSVLRTVVGSIVAVFLQYTMAYVLLKKGLPFRSIIVWFLTIPMFIGGGLISEYVIYGELGLRNTFFVYIFPTAFSFYNMVIIRTYLQGIPESLMESARLDGAGEFTILLKIMLPLSLPIIATVMLWCAVSHWNNWTDTLYFISDSKKNHWLRTLQFQLHLLEEEYEAFRKNYEAALERGDPSVMGNIEVDATGGAMHATQLLITTLPIVCVYPFAQKYFITGIMLGGVKE